MNFIVQGTFETWSKLLPKAQKSLDTLKDNKKKYESKTEEFEQMMKEGYNLTKLIDELDQELI